MPTLLATHTAAAPIQRTLNSPCLRTWLRGDWAILFSHPDDFVTYDFEMDRWLVVMRQAFAERHIKPIALASPGREVDMSWVTQVTGDERTVLLEGPAQQHFGPVDLQVPVLKDTIEHSEPRFAMVIDNALRIQKTFTYRSRSELPSPLELLGWADTLRSRQTARPQPSVPRDLTHAPRPASYLRARMACVRTRRTRGSATHTWAAVN